MLDLCASAHAPATHGQGKIKKKIKKAREREIDQSLGAYPNV
jgi:hypothetical protein